MSKNPELPGKDVFFPSKKKAQPAPRTTAPAREAPAAEESAAPRPAGKKKLAELQKRVERERVKRKAAAKVSPREGTARIGRPRKLTEDWTKITTIMTFGQVVELDRMSLEVREQTHQAVPRSELVRFILDAVLGSRDMKKQVVESILATRPT